MADVPEEKLQGSCWLGYVNFLYSVNKFAGTWAESHPVKSNEQVVSPQYYKTREFSQSTNLRQVRQQSGGVMPRVNKGIGAPQCTFVYGAIQPGAIFPYTPLIKGPTANYAPNYSSESPLVFVDSSKNTTESEFQNGEKPHGNEPTVPTNTLSSVYNQSPAPSYVTTYNIWELQNLTSEFDSAYTIRKNQGYSFKETNSANYTGPQMFQHFDKEGVSVGVSSFNTTAYVHRIFPLNKDLLYESGCKIYYPEKSTTPKSPNLDPKYGNCSFHLNFLHNEIGNYTARNNNPQIVVRWASGRTQNTISDFVLYLLPNEAPRLYYYHPQYKKYIYFQLNGPSLQTGEINVYVHFVGPVMLIGFEEDPTDWNVFSPVPEYSGLLEDKVFYPMIDINAQIAMSITNMNTCFKYSPLTFNNFNLDENKNTFDNKYKIFNIASTKNTNETDEEALGKIQANLQNNAHLNDTIEEIPAKKYYTETFLGPTYYADWRNISGFKNQLKIELGDKTGDYYVAWKTTIEGPLFLSVCDKWGDKKTEVKATIKNLSDLSSYLTTWTVTYTPEAPNTGDKKANTCFLKGTAEVTLVNLILSEEGRKILALIEENTMLITLSGGYSDKKLNRFFQGLVNTANTTYHPNGSTTILNCEDVASVILSNTTPQSSYRFISQSFKIILKGLLERCGFEGRYTVNESPYTNTTLNGVWTNMLNNHPNTAVWMSMAFDKGILAITPTDSPGTIKETILKILNLLFDKHMFPIMYWNYEKDGDEEIVLTTRQSYSDLLTFYGEMSEQQFLPTNKHGIIKGDYTIEINQTTQYNGYLFYAQNYILGPIMERSKELSAEGPSLERESPQEYPWVGYHKSKVKNFSQLYYIQTWAQTLAREQIEIENTLKILYHNITFDVYVTEPLNHWASFKIASFNNNGSNTQITDIYSYSSVIYTFIKADNTLIAKIKGEVFPRVQG